MIVIHRILREGDPTFKDDLINYVRRGRFLQISNFKDDSSALGRLDRPGPLVIWIFFHFIIRFLYAAWDCSAWIRTYALFLEEKLEYFRILRYDIEAEWLTKPSPTKTQVSLFALPFNFIHTSIFPCYFYYYFYALKPKLIYRIKVLYNGVSLFLISFILTIAQGMLSLVRQLLNGY